MTTILNNSNLKINNITIPYEGNIIFSPGGAERKPNVQNNGYIVYTTDNATNFAVLKVTVRNGLLIKDLGKDINAVFEDFRRNEGNNVISYGTKNLVNATLINKPEIQQQETTEYEFNANSLI
jgi:hypothetical protein